MAAILEWPNPPHFSFPVDAEGLPPEECLVTFIDGHTTVGRLIRFQPDQAVIELQSSVPGDILRILPSSIRYLRLTRPLFLSKNNTALELRASKVYPASAKQAFMVEFTDGQSLKGDTRGFVREKAGLYLYMVDEGDQVLRCFVPADSLKKFEIGEPLGKALVENKVATPDDVEAGLKKQEQLRSRRIGDYLVAKHIVTPEQLMEALKNQVPNLGMKLGETLVQEGFITQWQLEEALRRQRQDRKAYLGQILIDMGVVSKEVIKGMLAHKMGVPFVNLQKFSVDPNVVKLVSQEIAHRYSVMPLYRFEKEIIVAMENIMLWEPIEALRFYTQLKVTPVMASEEDIAFAIRHYYGSRPGDMAMSDLASRLATEQGAVTELEEEEESVKESDNTLVRLVNKMILDAFDQNVSDIHVETYPGKHSTIIRFRKDGSMVLYQEIPSNFRNALISRIKIMCQLDISEKRHPQDGKIVFHNPGYANIELRVATIPTTAGLEDIVLRVLASAKPLPVDKLGLRPSSLEAIRKIADRPYGLFLVCGPTGSGKTTTLHSILGYINTPERKIWTAEDPIEISQEGLRQVQVNAKIGWTFAHAMRSFLRADPDVIMVGEMRDQETTKIGVEASLTGHLVFSTLHTNSAPESVVRLLDLGMDPFNFADALLGILAQRLVKRLCTKCRKARAASQAEIGELLDEYCLNTHLDREQIRKQWQESFAGEKGKFTLYGAVGCDHCDSTGYRGRLGVHELLVATPAVKKLIQSRSPVEKLVEQALKDGMVTLKQDGIEKVLQGHTDIKQVRAVCS
jgi:type II secretory ATPase GspE/PulE/Tfp pilus assembly ATPase PilB-like protein